MATATIVDFGLMTRSENSSNAHIHEKTTVRKSPFAPSNLTELPPPKREDFEAEIKDLDDDWINDPDNARNWTASRKWTAVAIVSMYTFVAPLSSSMIAPGLLELAQRYNITNEVVIGLMLSIYLLSFAIAPLFLAPLSEMYGRTWVLHLGNIFSIGFTLGCAFAPNVGSLIGFRFLAGLSGSAPIACGGGSVGDLFSDRDRAGAMAVYNLGPLVGPVVGPIAGGYIAQTIGTKYDFIVVAALFGLASIIGIPFLRETYAPVIRLRRARKSSDPEALARISHIVKLHEDKGRFLWENLTRPMIMLTRSFICFIFSLYLAFLYGIYYLMFATFAHVFSTVYGFKVGPGGLAYIGLGIGFLAATLFCAKTADQVYKYLADKNGGKGKPEMRIPALFLGSLVTPIGLFWYGWSAEARIHWIMPIIGTCIFAFGLAASFTPIQLYLIDAFQYAASATAASAVFRSFFGFAFPLFGEQMFAVLGIGPGNSLLAGLAIVLGIPFPVWIYYRGEAMRMNSKLKL